MAEVERARSTRWRRVPPTDPEAADRAWLRAEALDGGRAAGIGEEPAQARAAAATLVLEIAALSFPRFRALLDGAETSSTVATRAGPHALVVTSDGAPVWAAWIEAPAGSSLVRAAAPTPPACSTGDLDTARATAAQRGVAVPDSTARTGIVDCERWVAAEGGSHTGAVLVSICERSRCGPPIEWREPGAWATAPTLEPPKGPKGKWPAWATWALVGAGVAIATGVTIAASGVLQPAPAETRFVSGGIKTQ
jgi:hypothetical protein